MSSFGGPTDKTSAEVAEIQNWHFSEGPVVWRVTQENHLGQTNLPAVAPTGTDSKAQGAALGLRRKTILEGPSGRDSSFFVVG